MTNGELLFVAVFAMVGVICMAVGCYLSDKADEKRWRQWGEIDRKWNGEK